MKTRIAISTEATQTMGMGHLTRMLHLAESLNKDYDFSFFVITDEESIPILDESRFQSQLVNSETCGERIRDFNPQLILVDRRDTDKLFLKELRKITRIITFDNSGNTDYADRVINALPLANGMEVPSNYSGLNYLILNDKIQSSVKHYAPMKTAQILVTFGGSDPGGLSRFVYKIFKELPQDYNVKFVLGPLYSGEQDFSPYTCIRTNNIFQEISEADIVITSFGMTVFESLFIGTHPIVINPTPYHNSLAKTLDLITNLGVGGTEETIDSIQAGLLNVLKNTDIARETYRKSRRYIDNKGKVRIGKIISSLLEKPEPECSVCGEKILRVVSRKEEINKYYCENCGSLCRDSDYTVRLNYESHYFVEDYKKQYGKTYLEDKSSINKLNENRLQIIDSLVDTKRTVKPLLELGSAMGFFLEKSLEHGYQPEGIEISKYAASYCKYTAGLNVTCGDFLKLDYSRPVYEVAACWYFIEHIQSFQDIIHKIHQVLRDGGIFALSTPNCEGITGKKNIYSYADRIPDDHYVEFSPRSLTLLLEKYGFKVEKIVSTGVHYERWLDGRNNLFYKNKIAEKIYHKIADKKHLGDTFEIYARKG